MKYKFNFNQLSTVATTVVIMLIISLSTVSTNALTQYGINSTTTGGGDTITYEADLLSPDNSYVVEAHAKNGYAFDHWSIDGSYSLNFCTVNDSTINITLFSNCKATAHFKSTYSEPQPKKHSSDNSKNNFFGLEIPFVAHAVEPTDIHKDENTDKITFAHVVAALCVVIVVVVGLYYLFKYGKLFFNVNSVRKQRNDRRKND